jgi:ATP synthase I chain
MMKTANSKDHFVLMTDADTALETRIFRVMAVSVVLALIISAALAPWRSTSGLALGGILSLFNYHWLRSSVSGLIAANASDQMVGHSASRYVLRYALIGSVVIGAYTVGIVSLPATIIGLCSFVAAFFAEALRQFYIAIVQREEIT